MNPNAVLPSMPGFRLAARVPETLRTGLAGFDDLTNGFPRGAISEIAGAESSGRTTLVYALLAASTQNLEICAYVDTSNSFDPCSAAASGVALSQLVWICCGHDAEHALKAADSLLHAGGFGVVVLDLSLVSDRVCRRIPLSWWYRFRHTIENTPTILALIEREPVAKSCASLILELKRKQATWTGAPGFHLLKEVEVEAVSRKPVRSRTAIIQAGVI